MTGFSLDYAEANGVYTFLLEVPVRRFLPDFCGWAPIYQQITAAGDAHYLTFNRPSTVIGGFTYGSVLFIQQKPNETLDDTFRATFASISLALTQTVLDALLTNPAVQSIRSLVLLESKFARETWDISEIFSHPSAFAVLVSELCLPIPSLQAPTTFDMTDSL